MSGQVNKDAESDEDVDALLAELEAETDNTNDTAYQQRLQELQTTARQSTGTASTAVAKQESYLVLKSDADTLQFTTEHQKAIVHFRHSDFGRCEIMDSHLDRISQRHLLGEANGDDLAFARVDVSHVPFLVEKLGVRILPCVIGFEKGIVKGKVVGFEGICWDSREKDPSVSKALEALLFSWGLLRQKLIVDDHDTESEGDSEDERAKARGLGRRGVQSGKSKNVGEDDDWD